MLHNVSLNQCIYNTILLYIVDGTKMKYNVVIIIPMIIIVYKYVLLTFGEKNYYFENHHNNVKQLQMQPVT